MKLLLTSAGIYNRSIGVALHKLVGKRPADIKVGFVPTAVNSKSSNKNWFIAQLTNLQKYGFNWIDIVDPSAGGTDWRKRLEPTDVIFISGGNTFHLLDQARKSGLFDWLKSEMGDKVYVGSSAGSILATPTIKLAGLGDADENEPGLKDLAGLELVDFELMPHVGNGIKLSLVEEHAKTAKHNVYALDDQSAIKVVDGKAEVISEGQWKLFSS